MSKEIQLTRGQKTIVDDEDYEYLMQWKWHCNDGGYAVRRTPKGPVQAVRMHRQLLNAPDGLEVDHINGNRLDNRRCNLRLVTRSQNQINRARPIDSKSKYKGVSYDWIRRIPAWKALIRVDGKVVRIGLFKTEREAALAYNEAAKKYHGEFARLNDV